MRRGTGDKYPELRKPRLVILYIPSEITMENIREALTQQNTEIDIKEGCFEQKFSYATKRGTRNLVAEVDSETRNNLQKNQGKIRVDNLEGGRLCISQEMLPLR